IARSIQVSALFPYTTLFRSRRNADMRRRGGGEGAHRLQHLRQRLHPARTRERHDEMRIVEGPIVVADAALADLRQPLPTVAHVEDRKSTRLNFSHVKISYAV